MTWVFENDEEGLAGPPMDQWVIRNEDTSNRDIVAVVPKTGDDGYDNAVTYPNVCRITAAPELLAALEDTVIKATRQREQLSKLLDVSPECPVVRTALTENALILNGATRAIAKAKGDTA